MSRILLIDDDENLGPPLAAYFQRFDLALEQATRPSEGLARLKAGGFDAAILDVMLPEMDGFALCRAIRKDSDLPLLMLTARGEVMDRVVGLELGADDYVPKPCTPRELAARLRAILRRVEEGGKASLAGAPVLAGPLTLWPARRTAQWQGQSLELTGTEFNLLLVLARQAGQVVARNELSEQGLGRPLARFDRSIDVHVSSLRQKLGPRPDGEPWIVTARGMGYQFVQT